MRPTLADLRNAQATTKTNSPAPFPPLDTAIVNASIAAFYIGRDSEGFWLARDIAGKNAGAFLLRSSAIAYARRTSQPNGCAIIFPAEPFELDVENRGNPLVDYLRRLRRALANLVAGLRAGSHAH